MCAECVGVPKLAAHKYSEKFQEANLIPKVQLKLQNDSISNSRLLFKQILNPNLLCVKQTYQIEMGFQSNTLNKGHIMQKYFVHKIFHKNLVVKQMN